MSDVAQPDKSDDSTKAGKESEIQSVKPSATSDKGKILIKFSVFILETFLQ